MPPHELSKPPHELSKSHAGYTGLGLSSTTKVPALALGGGHRSEERALKEAAEALQQLQPQAFQQRQLHELTLSAFTTVPPHESSKHPPDNPEVALKEDQLAKERALKVLTLLALLVHRYKY